MVITCNRTPFHHIFIKDTFSDSAYQEVWDEMVFLRLRMQGPETTGAAYKKSDPSVRKKRGVGIFLEKIYTDMMYSSISFHTKRLIEDKTLFNNAQTLAEENYYFKHWNPANFKMYVLAQYYKDRHFYKPHHDVALFSSVTVLHQKPKAYSGGNFSFPEFDYTVELEDNTTVIFPSSITHEVDEVEMEESDGLSGRFSITNFINLRV